MSDLKLFRTQANAVTEIKSESISLEKSLQTLIEQNLETMMGIQFLASEYTTGKTHSGRIDTLGIDENLCPVILEYKRAVNENVINQGLFYLDWLLDHKAEFKLLVMDKLGRNLADAIDWSGTRLICIAPDFNRYDEHAVQQINRNVELIRFRRFGGELLLLELANAVSVSNGLSKSPKPNERNGPDKAFNQTSSSPGSFIIDLFESVRAHLTAMGDDVQEKHLKLYIAFKRLRNFACIEIHKDKLLLYLKVDPDTVYLEPGFSRDVRTIGHWGTGDLEITIRNVSDFERTKPLFQTSYEDS